MIFRKFIDAQKAWVDLCSGEYTPARGMQCESILNEYFKVHEIPQKGSEPARVCPQPIVESDEYVCRQCFLRWSLDEGKPECLRER